MLKKEFSEIISYWKSFNNGDAFADFSSTQYTCEIDKLEIPDEAICNDINEFISNIVLPLFTRTEQSYLKKYFNFTSCFFVWFLCTPQFFYANKSKIWDCCLLQKRRIIHNQNPSTSISLVKEEKRSKELLKEADYIEKALECEARAKIRAQQILEEKMAAMY